MWNTTMTPGEGRLRNERPEKRTEIVSFPREKLEKIP